MKRSSVQLVVIAVLVVAAIALVIWRPAQLTVHPAPEATVENGAAPPSPRLPVRARPRPLVYVAGAVVHPGVYAVADDARARDALAEAGGATPDADLVAVNLAARINDGDEIAVPRRGDPTLARAQSAARRTGHSSGRRRHRLPADARPAAGAEPSNAASALIDLNTADAEALSGLPGIGPALAERIVAFRTLNGPFESVDGLADVAGITPARLDEVETLVTVGH